MVALGTLDLGALLPTDALAQNNPSWFVLRHQKTSFCHTRRHISLHGAYTNVDMLKAGGPYDTKEEAQKRLKELQDLKRCARR